MTLRPSSRWFWIAAWAELGCLGLMSRHGNFLLAGEGWKFTGLGLLAGVSFWLAVSAFTRAEGSFQSSARLFWIVAVALRLAVLAAYPGDDLWRYRWEGRIQLHGFNPYQLAPDAPALISLRDGDWAKINHRDFPAIYPPMIEGIFAVLAACHCPVIGYKLLFTLADLGTVAILRRLLVRQGSLPGGAAWYAWNPMAVYVSAGAAHFDSLMVCALLGAVLLLDACTAPAREKDAKPWQLSPSGWGSALLLGTAMAVKIVPAVLLPVWACALGWRRAILALPASVAVVLVAAMPYGFPQVHVFAALGNFVAGFRVNDVAWWLVETAVRAAPSGAETMITALVCGGVAISLRRDWRRGALWVSGTALLLSPVVHAWYVLWVLPLAAWRGPSARPWFVLSISMFGYFLLWEVNHASARPWQEPPWLRLFIYLPPLAAWAGQRLLRPSTDAPAVGTC